MLMYTQASALVASWKYIWKLRFKFNSWFNNIGETVAKKCYTISSKLNSQSMVETEF